MYLGAREADEKHQHERHQRLDQAGPKLGQMLDQGRARQLDLVLFDNRVGHSALESGLVAGTTDAGAAAGSAPDEDAAGSGSSVKASVR